MIKSAIENGNFSGLISRFSQDGTKIIVEREPSDKSSSPFLFENNEAPVIGGVYSNFVIDTFDYNQETFDFNLKASISMAETYKTIKLSADVRNESEITNDYQTAPQLEHHTKGFTYCKSANLKDVFHNHKGDHAEVLVFAELTDLNGTVTHAAVMKDDGGLQKNFSVIHPSSHDECYEIGDGSDPDEPAYVRKMPLAEYVADKKNPNLVTIALFRMPAAPELADVDYLCNFGKQGYYPVLGIPSEGILTLTNAKFVTDGSKEMPSVTCSISSGQSGGVTVIAASSGRYEKNISCDFTADNILHYNLVKYSWHEAYTEPGGFDPKTYVYQISISFYAKSHQGEAVPYLLSWRSGEPLNEGSPELLPALIIAWGCLEETTPVLMADGSRRKIKDISIGESIMSTGGKTAAVKNIWLGTDEHCYKITDEHGNSVTATYNHPFPSADGWKCSADIHVGDMLFDKDGEKTRVTNVEKTGRALNIVNLEFDEPSIIIANGLQTGDYAMQNGIFPK